MKKYIVKSEKKRVFRLFDGDRELGLLRYLNWYSQDAEVELSYKKLLIKSEGFWKRKMGILENDTELMSYHMDWKGMVITWRDRTFYLRSAGIFSPKFNLTEKESREPLLTIKYNSWRLRGPRYEMESSAGFESLPLKEIFLPVTVSAANYYLMMIASAAA